MHMTLNKEFLRCCYSSVIFCFVGGKTINSVLHILSYKIDIAPFPETPFLNENSGKKYEFTYILRKKLIFKITVQ